MFVPWSVLHELDSLSKSEREIRILARKAIAFVQDQLGDANSRVSVNIISTISEIKENFLSKRLLLCGQFDWFKGFFPKLINLFGA